jgi:hypothetical protein
MRDDAAFLGRWPWPAALCLWLGFAGLALLLYHPAASGPLITDDYLVLTGPYMGSLSGRNLLDILDPRGDAVALTWNYAPVHLLAHALEIQLFGARTTGYHIVNILLHASNAVLLCALFRRTPLPFGLAALGGLAFLLHPANVEAVAWIFQLKTQLCLLLGIAALLLHERHPALALAAFGLALLAKISALFALPVALVAAWTRSGPCRTLPRWGWLAGWAAVLAAVAVPEFLAFRSGGEFLARSSLSAPDRLQVILAIASRYAVLTATSWGASTSHQPDPPESWLDPWLLGGAVFLVLCGWRAIASLRARSPEAMYWALAAASYLPISQIWSFKFAMADRYLYTILPGLLGVLLVWSRPLAEDLSRRGSTRLTVGVLLALGILLIGFGVHTRERAWVWTSGPMVVRDAARHYPDGVQAELLRVSERVSLGDVDGTIAALERAHRKGLDDPLFLVREPALASLRSHPRVQRLLRTMATQRIEGLLRRSRLTRLELASLARFYYVRGDLAEAVGTLERAMGTPGVGSDAALAQELEMMRAALERSQRGGDARRSASP